jgi:hypothetical protein
MAVDSGIRRLLQDMGTALPHWRTLAHWHSTYKETGFSIRGHLNVEVPVVNCPIIMKSEQRAFTVRFQAQKSEQFR